MMQLASERGSQPQRIFRLLGALLLLSATSSLSREAPAPTEEAISVLIVDTPIDLPIAGEEKHRYRVELEAGSHWLVTAEQQGIDLKLTAFDSEGTLLFSVNNPLARYGRESLVLDGDVASEFIVEVTPAQRFVSPGRYRIEIAHLSNSTRRERSVLEAEQAMSEAARLSGEATAESQQLAVDIYLETREQWRALGEKRREAESLHNAAALSAFLGNSRAAVDRYREAVDLWRAVGDRRLEGTALNDLGFNSRNLGEIKEASKRFEQAVSIRREAGDHHGEGVARSNLCSQLEAQGKFSEALDCFQEVLLLFEKAGEGKSLALTLNSIGGMHLTLGDPEPALANFERAHQTLKEIGDRRGQAQMLNSLAFFHRNTGEFQTAIDYYRSSAEILEGIGDRRLLARTVNNIGFAYLSLGEPQRARAFLQEALQLRREAGDKRGEGITLNNLGNAALALGNPEEALGHHHATLALAKEADDQMTTGRTMASLARAHLTSGKPESAVPLLTEALGIAEDLGNVRNEAEALLLKGQTELALATPLQATASLKQAINRFESFGNQSGKAEALAAVAKAQHQRGNTSTALANVRESLELFESLRIQVDSPHLRATFLASVREAYELLIDLLMEMDRIDPGAGFAHRALEASERSKARSLLDTIGNFENLSTAEADRELLDQRRVLRRELHAQAGRQHRLLQRPHSKEQATQLQQDVQEAVSDLEAIDATIRRQNPSFAAIRSPATISVADIQDHLDEDTLLLEYSLGRVRSYLWVVSESSVTAHELPSREDIEALARRAYVFLNAEHPIESGNGSESLFTLSRILLGPVATVLDDQRIAVVADGALHYLPFAALPNPASLSDPLLLRHEIVYVPSFSVLDALRKRRRADRAETPSIAILADPVFDRYDRRVQNPGTPPDLERIEDSVLDRAARRLRSSYFERLPATRLEAEAIADLFATGRVHQLLDFDASRSALFDQSLQDYQILHIATHGVVDAENPELSALVLSLVNERGLPRQGYLRQHDLYGLDLNADLVVLSGCQTALGLEVRGEGMLGITRGFMYAGVPQALASLWRIEDSVTAELMRLFYSALIVGNATPAAALRESQISLLNRNGAREYQQWAAFVVQGDWQW